MSCGSDPTGQAVGPELNDFTIFKLPPASTAIAAAVSSMLTKTLMNDRRKRYEQLRAEALESARNMKSSL